MAVSRKTQKDVGKFEAKFIGPFTKTQTIFVGIGAVLAILMKLLMDAIGAPTEVMVVAIVIVAAPCALLGFKKFNGMSATEYIKLYIDTRMRNPGKRRYEVETALDVKSKEIDKKTQDPNKKVVKYVHKPSAEFPDYK